MPSKEEHRLAHTFSGRPSEPWSAAMAQKYKPFGSAIKFRQDWDEPNVESNISGSPPMNSTQTRSIELMDDSSDIQIITSMRDTKQGMSVDSRRESESLSGSDDSQCTRKKHSIHSPMKATLISHNPDSVSPRPWEKMSRLVQKRVSLAAPSILRRSASETSLMSTMSDASVSSTHDRRSLYPMSTPHSSSVRRSSKVLRRNYDDVDAAADSFSMRSRGSVASAVFSHRRSRTRSLSTFSLEDSMERRLEALQARMVREQMGRASWQEKPLLLPDDGDEDELPGLLCESFWSAEFPGEWPSLTDMRRPWAMGRDYRAVYKGTWGPYDTAEGQGTLTRPHKVEYEGEFQDGMCHGAGAIHYPNGAVIRGTWERGRLLQPAYIAADGLNFDPDGPYCVMPDRRFYTEIQNGLRPGGRSQLTNQHPPRPVPPGCYDAGDGIFDPRRNCIYNPDTMEVVRVPTNDQMNWIKENCRKGWDENVGYRPELFENWWVESPVAESLAEEEEEEEEEEEVEEEEERAEEEEEEEVAMEEEGSVRMEPTMEERFDAMFEEEEPTHVPDLHPPIAVQDVALDATPAEDIYPFLFPETEEEGKTVVEKLMVPVSTELTQENLRMRQRFLNALEAERAAAEARDLVEKKREEEEAAAKAREAAEKAKAESPPSTPRLSLDETEEVYKGPWRHVARRLVPLLRQRLEEDRKTAAKKWQEDLVQLLTERASKAGLEMSASGYLGAAQSVADLTKPRGSRVIIPPGLEERARQRRAEREEREREAEEKRQAEAEAKMAAKEQDLRDAEVGSDSDEIAPEPEELPEMQRRRPSVLPSRASAAPKGGRESAGGEERGRSSAAGKKKSLRLAFKEDQPPGE